MVGKSQHIKLIAYNVMSEVSCSVSIVQKLQKWQLTTKQKGFLDQSVFHNNFVFPTRSVNKISGPKYDISNCVLDYGLCVNAQHMKISVEGNKLRI